MNLHYNQFDLLQLTISQEEFLSMFKEALVKLDLSKEDIEAVCNKVMNMLATSAAEIKFQKRESVDTNSQEFLLDAMNQHNFEKNQIIQAVMYSKMLDMHIQMRLEQIQKNIEALSSRMKDEQNEKFMREGGDAYNRKIMMLAALLKLQQKHLEETLKMMNARIAQLDHQIAKIDDMIQRLEEVQENLDQDFNQAVSNEVNQIIENDEELKDLPQDKKDKVNQIVQEEYQKYAKELAQMENAQDGKGLENNASYQLNRGGLHFSSSEPKAPTFAARIKRDEMLRNMEKRMVEEAGIDAEKAKKIVGKIDANKTLDNKVKEYGDNSQQVQNQIKELKGEKQKLESEREVVKQKAEIVEDQMLSAKSIDINQTQEIEEFTHTINNDEIPSIEDLTELREQLSENDIEDMMLNTNLLDSSDLLDTDFNLDDLGDLENLGTFEIDFSNDDALDDFEFGGPVVEQAELESKSSISARGKMN